MARLASEDPGLSEYDFKFMFNSNTVPIKVVSVIKSLIGKLKNPKQSKMVVTEVALSRPAEIQRNDFSKGLLQDPSTGETVVEKIEDVSAN